MTADSKSEGWWGPSSDCHLFVLSMSPSEQRGVAGYVDVCSIHLRGENTGFIHKMGLSLGNQWHLEGCCFLDSCVRWGMGSPPCCPGSRGPVWAFGNILKSQWWGGGKKSVPHKKIWEVSSIVGHKCLHPLNISSTKCSLEMSDGRNQQLEISYSIVWASREAAEERSGSSTCHLQDKVVSFPFSWKRWFTQMWIATV